jgi:hypothetical protein
VAVDTGSTQAKIFVSYRRRETAGHAGRLYDRLAEHFGDDRVFMDVEIEAGVDFAEQINQAVGSCGALIVLIGEQWLTVVDAEGRRRIDDPADVHRVEIEAALNRHVRVIPALVQGARMPEAEDLPPALSALGRRQAVELSDQRWDYDVGRLVGVLERVLPAQDAPAPDAKSLVGLLTRHPWRMFVTGACAALIAVGAALAGTGYFSRPLLAIGFTDPARYAATLKRLDRCPVKIRSEYTVKTVDFVLDGDDPIVTERDPPFLCDSTGRARWDTCFSRPGHRIRPGRHRLTARVTDFHDNTATAAITVRTPTCAGSP